MKKFTAWRKKRKLLWESLCKKCGICCYEKDFHFLFIRINKKYPCDYLDIVSSTCSVYEDRFQVCRFCGKVTMFHALFSRALPATCGYVEKYRRIKLFPTARIPQA
ncbi:MAG: hypothetical protein JW904_09125 [Spirochaetales bacterium]|nr:hypothetical protein [Spirochaetales bacterium]